MVRNVKERVRTTRGKGQKNLLQTSGGSTTDCGTHLSGAPAAPTDAAVAVAAGLRKLMGFKLKGWTSEEERKGERRRERKRDRERHRERGRERERKREGERERGRGRERERWGETLPS